MKESRLCFLHGKSSVYPRRYRGIKLIVTFVMIFVGTLVTYGSTGNSGLKYDGEILPQTKVKVLTGVVLGQDRDTLPGVNVVIKGTTQGVITDAHGKFMIPLPEKTDG